MKAELKIGLFFTNTEKDYNKSVASTWIRIWQMMDIYKSLGANVYLNDYTRKYDVAIVYRKSKRKYYNILRYLRLISKTIYFDTCINLFEENAEINKTRLKYAHKITKVSDGLICASHQISEYAKPHAKSVFTMEDPINMSHFHKKKERINFDNPTFGWSGAGVKSIFLNDYSDKINGSIHIISEKQIEEVKLDFSYSYSQWKYETFPDELLKCDIALLPRDTKSSYNKGHSSFKALVYAVSGIPIIANKVPSYLDMAKFYDGIVFLEDHNDSIDNCIAELKNRKLNTKKLRVHYSREHQAALLLSYFKQQLNK